MDRDAARRRGLPPDVHDEDDIEILEVVGLTDDPETETRVEPSEDGEGDEIVLEFADDGEPTFAPRVSPPPPASVALDRFVRLQADFDNLRKRTERERDEQHRYAAAVLVESLLPVLDNLERALSAPTAGTGESALREGLVLVHRQFLDELSRAGLRPIRSVGEPFDPLVHEAVETVSRGEAAPNEVVAELQRGYWFHERVLRPALVRVAVDEATPGSSGTDGGEG